MKPIRSDKNTHVWITGWGGSTPSSAYRIVILPEKESERLWKNISEQSKAKE